MSAITTFPARYRRNIRRLKELLCTDYDTAYAMMLMTAALNDLRPDDPEIVNVILMDCQMEVDIA